MSWRVIIILFSLVGLTVNAQSINVRGKVSNAAGKPLANAVVTLVGQKVADTTGADGMFAIVKPEVAVLPVVVPQQEAISLNKGILEFSLTSPSAVKVEVFDVKGKLLKKELSQNAVAGIYRLNIAENLCAANLLVINASIGRHMMTFRYFPVNNGITTIGTSLKNIVQDGSRLAKITAIADTLKTTASGYTTKVTPISSYDTEVNISLDTAGGTVSSGCGKANPPASGKATIRVEDLDREYIVKIPASYDPNKSYKLIFCIHAWGGDYESIAKQGYYGLEKLANNTAIFVSPQGLEDNGQARGWFNPKGRDIKFIKALVDYLSANVCIDQERIFSTGFSFGGMMSFAISCAMSDVFRAIAPMSGAFYSGCDSSTTSGPVAMWMAHGKTDTVVPLADGKKALMYILGKNGCGSQTIPVNPSPCVAYQGCKEGYPVIYCEFDGGHAPQNWAAAATWEFFSQF